MELAKAGALVHSTSSFSSSINSIQSKTFDWLIDWWKEKRRLVDERRPFTLIIKEIQSIKEKEIKFLLICLISFLSLLLLFVLSWGLQLSSLFNKKEKATQLKFTNSFNQSTHLIELVSLWVDEVNEWMQPFSFTLLWVIGRRPLCRAPTHSAIQFFIASFVLLAHSLSLEEKKKVSCGMSWLKRVEWWRKCDWSWSGLLGRKSITHHAEMQKL